MGMSLAQQLAALPQACQDEYLAALSDQAIDQLLRDWGFWARPEQLEPQGDWFIWLLLCGRGFGKTRTGAETFVQWVIDNPVADDGAPTEWLVAGKTFGDTVNAMLMGRSGIYARLEERGITYKANGELHRITLSTGQVIHYRHGDNDDLARSLNLSGAWLDELGTWRKRVLTMWREGLVPAVRIAAPGWAPRILITTTPKVAAAEPLRLLKELVGRAAAGGDVVVTKGTTFDNASNLAPAVLAEYEASYPKGSRAYRQELLAELIDEVEGALMEQWGWIDDHRVTAAEVPDLFRSTVTVDPAVTSGPNSDETGIMVGGVGRPPGANEDHYYVQADLSGRYTMAQWPVVAVKAAVKYNATILVEIDQGGDMNKQLIEDAARALGVTVRVETVRAGSIGSKAVRATPVVALYEKGLVHHVGEFEHYEAQWTTWVPGVDRKSPDRLDAGVYLIRKLRGMDDPRNVAVPVTEMW